MDKRTIWAFILIIAVWLISSQFIWKKSPPPARKSINQHEQNNSKDNADSLISDTPEIKKDLTVPEENEPEIPLHEDIVLENDKVILTFTNRGAQVKSIILKDYRFPESEELVDLLLGERNAFGVELYNESGRKIENTGKMFEYFQEGNKVKFTSDTITKTFSLSEGYRLDLSLEIEAEELSDYSILLADGIADTEKYLKRKTQNYQSIVQVDNKIERDNLGKLKEKQKYSGSIDWAAIRTKFFLMGIVKDQVSTWNQLEAFKVDKKEGSPAFRLFGSSEGRNLLSANVQIYTGPVIQKNLEEFGSGFEASYYAGNGIFYGQGFIKPISRLFNWVFQQLYKLIPVWGLCLIIFAAIIKILLYPLTHKSFESSHKLQKIQPQISALREQYKKDPQKMNAEMQRIYRENGVSPFGGCLPMLLQMPIFFALYPVIRYSIDLRQSGFLWMHDLSEPDKTTILPIIMGVFMFLQQKLMRPSNAALEKMTEQQKAQMQSQKMMMYIMPVIMFFIFKSFPAGLVLYWTVFNIMSTAQQRIIRKKFS